MASLRWGHVHSSRSSGRTSEPGPALATADDLEAMRLELASLVASHHRMEQSLVVVAKDVCEAVDKLREELSGSPRDSCPRSSGPLGETSKAPEPAKPALKAQSSYMLGEDGVLPVATGNDSQETGLPLTSTAPLKSPTSFVAPRLPASWPAVLEQRPMMWAGTTVPSKIPRPSHAGQRKFSLGDDGVHDKHRVVANVVRRTLTSPMMPSSWACICLDICWSLVLAYDIWMTPYMLAWDVEFSGALRAVAILTAAHWALDVAVQFNTAFYQDGDIITDRGAIASRYVRTWFLFDTLLVTTDCLSIALDRKVLRLLRMAGLLRLLRLDRLAENVASCGVSDTVKLFLQVFGLFSAILFFNHFMSCAWHVLGRAGPTDTGLRWFANFMAGDTPYEDLGHWYQYWTAVHWYLSQMTVGNDAFYCVNASERIFNVVGLIFGLLIQCTLISSVSAAMVQFQMAQTDQYEKLRTLRQFLCENSIHSEVAVLVWKQVRERLAFKDKLRDTDVPALALLSTSLRNELRLATFGPSLKRLPLLRLWAALDFSVIRDLCAEGIEFIFLMPQDDLFEPGSEAVGAYYLMDGNMEYVQTPDSSPVANTTRNPVPPRSWLCEAALWSRWIHVGSTQASERCQLLLLPASSLMRELQRHFAVQDVTAEYSTAFHKRLASAMPPNAPWPDDLQVPFTDYGELVMSMGEQVQVTIGLQALDHVHRRGPAYEKLFEEITNGQSILLVNSMGEPERVASVLAFEIRNDEGMLLVELGKLSRGSLAANCQMPGGKQERGEMPSDAMQRMLGTKLQPLESCLQVERMERAITWKESKEYRVRTKYLRTVCVARLRGREFAPEVPKVRPIRCEHERTISGQSGDGDREMGLKISAASGAGKTASAMSLDLDPPQELRDVFVFDGDQDKVMFYTWLSEEEFERLEKADMEPLLHLWLASVWKSYRQVYGVRAV